MSLPSESVVAFCSDGGYIYNHQSLQLRNYGKTAKCALEITNDLF